MLTAALLALASLASAHEQLNQRELISLRPPEVVPGLEQYSIAYHLDTPLSVSTEFFFAEIADGPARTVRKQNIFTSAERDAPNWLLMFTVENSERFNCARCESVQPEFANVAELLQIGQPDQNYIVGIVACDQQESARLCDYFHIKGVPNIMVIRPDDDTFSLQWTRYDSALTSFGIFNFAVHNFPFAFTTRKLPFYFNGGSEQAFMDGFFDYSLEFFQGIMEENFDVLRGVGLVETPVADYSFVYGMTVLATMSPIIIVLYIYAIYTIYLFVQKKRKEAREAKLVENDPDFEEDSPLGEQTEPVVERKRGSSSHEEAKKTK